MAVIHEPPISGFTAVSTYISYALLMLFGKLRETLDWLYGWWSAPARRTPDGYAPLVADWEDFFTRRMYQRIVDCWNRPIAGAPGAWMDIIERHPLVYGKPLEWTGRTVRALNLGSYNYLGFGDPDSPTKGVVLEAVEKFSVATSSTRQALGTTTIHRELEKVVARFVRKDDAMIFGMGFGTNSCGIPALVGKGSLIISDANNHSSIVIGARTSGATIRVFAHNDPEDLEMVVRKAIIDGQPRTHRPWKKILIVVEGIYSMEGEMCPLKEIVAIKKKYRCYLFVDEAHSIGAIGPSGRGITEHAKVNPADVDILMGTFTKSFGAVGGYLAANKEIISALREHSAGSLYSSSISPPAAQQVIAAMQLILGEDGTDLGKRKLTALRENSNMFRRRMMAMGVQTVGDWDSPIIPMLIYNPGKVPFFSREMLRRGIAVVVVGYPASALLLARTRFCISAAHKREDLEEALKVIEEVAKDANLVYTPRTRASQRALEELGPAPKFLTENRASDGSTRGASTPYLSSANGGRNAVAADNSKTE